MEDFIAKFRQKLQVDEVLAPIVDCKFIRSRDLALTRPVRCRVAEAESAAVFVGRLGKTLLSVSGLSLIEFCLKQTIGKVAAGPALENKLLV